MNDTDWMQYALELAKTAANNNEVPVGAVLTLDNKMIAEGWNRPISTANPTAHAEIIALCEGATALNNYRLINTTLYVTLEPCVMCVGAIVHARVKRVVFGALDPRTGAVQSVLNLKDAPHFNHKVEYAGGVLEEACGAVLKEFFKERR